MGVPAQYFRSAAATISYQPGGFIQLEWQSVAASELELRAIYEHVLGALHRHRSTRLLTVHSQRPPMPAEVQAWLTHHWVPRAVAEAGYSHCAVVEASTPLSRLAARAVGTGLSAPLQYRYFASAAEGARWLREA